MSYSDDSKLGKSFVLFLVIVFVALFGFRACATSVAQGNTHTETVVICGKESVQRSGENAGHEYRIYTSGSTYTVKDYFGSEGTRFNSADLYGKIQVGKTYSIKSYGYRIPWASSFWNIQSITPTTQEPTGTCG